MPAVGVSAKYAPPFAVTSELTAQLKPTGATCGYQPGTENAGWYPPTVTTKSPACGLSPNHRQNAKPPVRWQSRVSRNELGVREAIALNEPSSGLSESSSWSST